MKFEGPPARPPVPPSKAEMPVVEAPVVETQPAAPDESQRVEDVAKAQEMAEAGNDFRSKAVDTRKYVEATGDHGWGGSVARKEDEAAERKEDRVGRLFELKKQYPEMPDEEVSFLEWKQSEERSLDEINRLFREKFGKELPEKAKEKGGVTENG
jgi:hypothetical protein